ncbi:hypothetical protein HanHA300_Chr15g0587621 [Helianthus annuus]|nr:hypothetical protein HanHA300_Chr15g0587621 [Helianthus annuus]KAJ0475119.1 hypothetical protein HanHA89_Chr15g0637471 [Helianthus annuus]KAJ0650674.1 hypothetical protein HanLR1_Chr15g0598381 [Helianthus annuus]
MIYGFFLMVNPQSFVTIELGVFVNQNSRNTRRSHRLPKVMLKKVLLGIVLDTDDYKFDRYIAALIEMEDAKKLFNDCWNTKNDALKETPSTTSQCHLDTKGKSKVVCGDEIVSPKVKSKFDMDLDNFLIPKNKFRLHELSKNSHITYRTRLNVSRKNECVVIDIMKPSENITVKSKREACRSTTATADVRRKRTVKRLKNNSILEFTKVAEIKLVYVMI